MFRIVSEVCVRVYVDGGLKTPIHTHTHTRSERARERERERERERRAQGAHTYTQKEGLRHQYRPSVDSTGTGPNCNLFPI